MRILAFGCLLLLGFANPTYAAIYCVENVTRVIVHGNGNVYFQTDKTCSGGWCQLDWAESERINRAYSLLLAARTTNTELIFNWQLENCGQVNETYSSPGSVQM